MTALRDPILGERAKLAMRTDAGGHKRQKLFVLLAAYADAGEAHPPVRALLSRMGMGQTLREVHQIDALLGALEKQGLIRVEWSPRGSHRRNRYALTIGRGNGRQSAVDVRKDEASS